MDGLEQRRFKGISRIEHAMAAIRETARAIRADTRERRHRLRCAIAPYPTVADPDVLTVFEQGKGAS